VGRTVFVGPQLGTWFTSSLWGLDFSGCFWIFGKSGSPCHILRFRFLAAYELTPSFSSLFLHRTISSFRLKTISYAIQPSLCDFSSSYPNDNSISMQQNTFEGEVILSKVPQIFLAALFLFETILSTFSPP